MSVVEGLSECFKALSSREKSNLMFHFKRGTNIICGDDAHRWVLSDGYC